MPEQGGFERGHHGGRSEPEAQKSTLEIASTYRSFELTGIIDKRVGADQLDRLDAAGLEWAEESDKGVPVFFKTVISESVAICELGRPCARDLPLPHGFQEGEGKSQWPSRGQYVRLGAKWRGGVESRDISFNRNDEQGDGAQSGSIELKGLPAHLNLRGNVYTLDLNSGGDVKCGEKEKGKNETHSANIRTICDLESATSISCAFVREFLEELTQGV